MDLREALGALDPTNDDHWTSEGLPRVEAVAEISGNAQVKRQDITNADPEFNREKAKAAETVDPPAAGETDEPKAETEEDWLGMTDDAPEKVEEVEEEDPYAELSDDDILDLTVDVIASNYNLCRRVCDVLGEKFRKAVKARDAANQEIKDLSLRIDLTTRWMQKLEVTDPNASLHGVQAYLKRSQEAREVRTRRAQAFIKAGTTAEDVAAELSSKSKIDQAMNKRKGAIGSGRPAVRTPPAQG